MRKIESIKKKKAQQHEMKMKMEAKSNAEAIAEFAKYVDQYDQIILSLHASTVRPRNNYGFGEGLKELFHLFYL